MNSTDSGASTMMVALIAILVILAIGILLFRTLPGLAPAGTNNGAGIEINGSTDTGE